MLCLFKTLYQNYVDKLNVIKSAVKGKLEIRPCVKQFDCCCSSNCYKYTNMQ